MATADGAPVAFVRATDFGVDEKEDLRLPL